MEKTINPRKNQNNLSKIKNTFFLVILLSALFTAGTMLTQKAQAQGLQPCTITLCNISFESGADYWADIGSANNTISGDAIHGSSSMSSSQTLSAGGAVWAGISQPINGVQPGQTYTFNMWAKGTDIAQGHAKIKWYDAGSVLLQTDYINGILNGTYTNWLSISDVVTSPANTSTAKLFIQHGVDAANQNISTSNLLIDLISFKQAETACGVLCNGGFEQGTLYWNVNGETGSQMIETSGAYEGLYALKSEQLYTGADPVKWTGVSQSIKVNEGYNYYIKLWSKTSNAVHGHVKVRWLNSGGGEVSSVLAITGMVGTIPTWTRMETAAPIVAPSGAITAEVIIQHGVTASGGLQNVAGSTLWVDGVSFTCENLCNGGFEDGFSYWLNRGTPDNQISSDAAEGSNSLQSIHTRTSGDSAAWSGISQKVAAVGDTDYVFGMQSKSINAAQGHVKVSWYDSTDSIIGIDYPVNVINGTYSSWIPASKVLTSPANAVMAEVLFQHGVNTSNQNVEGSTIWVDKTVFRQATDCIVGELCNGGFEDDIFYWEPLGKFGSNTIDIIGEYEGSQSLRSEQLYTSGDAAKWAGVSQLVTLDPTASSYSLLLRYKALNSAHGHAKIKWLDSGGSLLSTELAITGMYGTSALWTELDTIVSVPLGAVKAEVIFQHGVTASGGLQNVPGSTLWLDGLLFSPTPTLSISAVNSTVTEGAQLQYEAVLDRSVNYDVLVDYTVSGSGSDPVEATDLGAAIYPSGTVTITAGSTSEPINISTVDDSLVESPEELAVTISLNSGTAEPLANGTLSETGTINDNEPTTSIPFTCTGEAYLSYDADTSLTQIDTAVDPYVFTQVGSPSGIKYDNMGYHISEGVLYGVELVTGGNNGLIKIDSTGRIFELGVPAGLPSNIQFNGGDISSDGTTMYLSESGQGTLYKVTLPGLTVTSVSITGDTGAVGDYAYNKSDGLLYGGDSTGQLSIIDPATGVRTDVSVTGLPSGRTFGGAWFDAAGYLFLYESSGTIYKVDLSGPTIVDTQPGLSSSRLDGASCIQGLIGGAKQMSSTTDGLPETVTIDYVFENLSVSEDLFNLSAADNLTSVFGTLGVDWTFTSISSVPASFANPSFNGSSATQLINQAPTQSLLSGAVATVTVQLELLTYSQAGGSGEYCNQVLVLGENAAGALFSDLSTDGLDPDPNGDGIPEEKELSCEVINTPVPFTCTGNPYISRDNNNTRLFHLDTTVAPFVFTQVGASSGILYDALGFNRSDGLMYAVEIAGFNNSGLVKIDSGGNIFRLGSPAGLPTGSEFNAGDISSDGSTMYLSYYGTGSLYKIDLSDLSVTSVSISGDTNGAVGDFAYNQTNSLLYGGDNEGQVAVIDPESGVRTDISVTGLPAAPYGYGGAWFNAAGNLFLYDQYFGNIQEIDLSTFTIVDTQTGFGFPAIQYLDGASCMQEPLGVAKKMSSTLDGLPETITIDYVFENFASSEDLFNLSADDDLAAVFGTVGVDWTFTSISSVPASFANPSFDGSTDTQLINQTPTQSLLAGSTSAITVVLELLTYAQMGTDNNYCNQVLATGENASGDILGDLSTEGLDPDTNGDGYPEEMIQSCVRALPPVPFTCSRNSYISHGADTQLTQVDTTVTPYTFVPVGLSSGIEYDNLGFRKSEGMMYAVELNETGGNNGLVKIDSLGGVFDVGNPAGLPAGVQFNAGDISSGGTEMYLSTSGHGDLYKVLLPGLTATSVGITGDTGTVQDFAYSPADGLLYGGDGTDGQLTILDPNTGVRNDVNVTGLPSGTLFGGAWFDGPDILFLYENNGNIYKIDISGPTIIDTQTGSIVSPRLDAASCNQDVIGAAKQMSSTTDGLPETLTIDYVFENFSATETIFNLSAIDALSLFFGAQGADWTFTSISSVPASFANPLYNGSTFTELINQLPTQSLPPSSIATITVEIELLTFSGIDGEGNICNQVLFTGQNPSGLLFGDLSTEGLDPDPDGNGYPDEMELSCTQVVTPSPFACTGSAYISSGTNTQLMQADMSVNPFVYIPIGAPSGIEYDNLGFRRSEGMMYGVELNGTGGNNGLIKIDSAGVVYKLGSPANLPTDTQFVGGDISADGTTMYLSETGEGTLYQVEIPGLAVTTVTITGDTGTVDDFAYNPFDGLLYGADSTDGELAVLDAETGVRSDITLTGLPVGSTLGGAWFDTSGNLFLFENIGTIYEIDLSIPSIIDTQTGPGSSRLDGASCVQDQLGAAKQMNSTSDGLPETVTINYTFENFSTTEDMFSLNASDNLSTVFGTPGVDWTFTSISSVPASFANPSYDGSTVPELINQSPTQSLSAGNTATITVKLELLTFALIGSGNEYCNQVVVAGENSSGVIFEDLSTSGLDPDPNSDGSPGESELSCAVITPPPSFTCNGDAYISQGTNTQLKQIDTSVSPYVYTSVGAPSGIEYDGLGYSQTEGVMYAVELNQTGGNNGLIKIESNGTVNNLGTPAGLPTSTRFNGGSISLDGTSMYLSNSGQGVLYEVSLPGLSVTSLPITGGSGIVEDFAYNPFDGLLYGGDSSDGQIAIINPVSGARTDINVSGLIPDRQFGGAWFNASGNLFLYRNDGNIYEINLSGPTIVNTHSGPSSLRLDATSCIQDHIGAAKQMSSTMDGLPETVTIDYVFENFSATDTMINLSVIEDLAAVFGVEGVDWTFTSISSPRAGFVNASFNGSADTELINQSTAQSLAAGSTASIAVSLELLTFAQIEGGSFCNQVLFEGRTVTGLLFSDKSTDGLDPDPNGDGYPDESAEACIIFN